MEWVCGFLIDGSLLVFGSFAKFLIVIRPNESCKDT